MRSCAVLLALSTCSACGGDARPPRWWSDPPADGTYLLVQDAADDAGDRVVVLDDGTRLLCPGEAETSGHPTELDPSWCVCLEPLACDSQASCPTGDEQVQRLTDALDPGPFSDRRVHCEGAAIGVCGPFRWFFFRDGHRAEYQFFGEAGRLVGRLDATDYPAFCEGRTLARHAGRIPDCPELVFHRAICGDERPRPWSPYGQIRMYVAPW